MVGKNKVYTQVNEGGLANESIFAIMLQTFKELTNPQTIINESSTIADWSRMANPTSPYCFKEASQENISIIKNLLKENKYAIFLRKVHKEFPSEALTLIMDYDSEHTYDVLHNQAKKKNLRGTNYSSIFNLICSLFTLWLITSFYRFYYFTPV
jgi:hypothetical protein